MKNEQEIGISAYCIDKCGLNAVQVADYAGVSKRTFYGWWNSKKPRRKVVKLIVQFIEYERVHKPKINIEDEDLSAFCRRNCNLDVTTVADYAEVSKRTFYAWWNGKKPRKRVVRSIVMAIRCEQEQNAA